MPLIPVWGMLDRFRRSPTLVVSVVFIAMMLDLVTLTTLEPILPSILYDLHLETNKEAMAAAISLAMSGNASSAQTPNSGQSEMGPQVKLKAIPEVRIQDMTRDVGILLAVKPGAEVLVNIAVGFVVDRFGHKTPMVAGCLCNVGATFAFAYVGHYWMLLTARVMQAVGSSLSVVSGLSLLACAFKNERERTWANGIAFGGLSVGIIVGFPLGSVCYEFLGRPAPFLILAGLMGLDAVMRLLIVTPTDQETPSQKKKSHALGRWLSLLFDPYIAMALGGNTFLHVGLGMVVATEAAWMIGVLGGRPWNVGVVLVIGALFQFGAQFLTGMYSLRVGRWLVCWLGLMLSAIGYILYPFCTDVWCVIGPECVCRAGLGALLAAISPLLAFISDSRHDSDYGAIYGLYAASYNMGLVIGPVTGGILMHVVGFSWMYRGMGLVLAVYSACFLCFRRLERQTHTDQSCPEEKKPILEKECSYGGVGAYEGTSTLRQDAEEC